MLDPPDLAQAGLDPLGKAVDQIAVMPEGDCRDQRGAGGSRRLGFDQAQRQAKARAEHRTRERAHRSGIRVASMFTMPPP